MEVALGTGNLNTLTTRIQRHTCSYQWNWLSRWPEFVASLRTWQSSDSIYLYWKTCPHGLITNYIRNNLRYNLKQLNNNFNYLHSVPVIDIFIYTCSVLELLLMLIMDTHNLFKILFKLSFPQKSALTCWPDDNSTDWVVDARKPRKELFWSRRSATKHLTTIDYRSCE